MKEITAINAATATGAHGEPPDPHPPRGTGSINNGTSTPFNQLIAPAWAEMVEARDRYTREAQRLRRWRWWFVGMFTFYAILIGILLARSLLGL